MLLKWGAPIDILNKNGDSCLHMASSRGHLNIVKLLLDMGTLATQHHNHSGKTPIQSAEANEYWQVVNTLKGTHSLSLSVADPGFSRGGA